jgi:hypothetical protein
MKKTTLLAVLVGAAAGSAHADLFTVDAKANSSTGGVGKATIDLVVGQAFTVAVDPSDLWSSGALPRWSNADGLVGIRYASGADDSGEVAGTLIGIDLSSRWRHGLSRTVQWTQGNLTAPYGTLVGQIGGGDFFVVGTNFRGNAANGGTLNLFFWDRNNDDNTQFITAKVNAVPEPETLALMVGGVGLIGFVGRRRAAAAAAQA